ncbi:EG45-like domain containing protein [Herrania umbratica]|uniref:EG45-like domain containing protein n=1 Tax=Herrania umbratica TaxID=108875 RepID=A0A6J0ZQK8_9ROSI|nr:EG45-like domain containing protein [Herrania umbratica]
MQIKKLPLFQPLSFLLFLSNLLRFSHADVGTAAQYSPPYLPTACYGDDQSQFPSTNLFAAAGDGIWDNGASCGRQYLVRCISASRPGTCVRDQTIQVKIVDYAPNAQSPPSASSTTIVLSETAFSGITNIAIDSINIEFQQV